MRDFFKQVVEEGLMSKLFSAEHGQYQERGNILDIPDAVFVDYYYCLALCRQIVNMYPDVKDVECEASVLWAIMHADLTRVPLPVALAAWLTVTDEFRWHHRYECPEDLAYGLVQKPYTQVVSQIGAFVAGYLKTQSERSLLWLPEYSEVMFKCQQHAINIYARLPNELKRLCRQEAEAEVNLVTH
jgi:hypothetical protein